MNYVYDEGGVYIRNLANNAEKYGVGQYCFAHNYELDGRELTVTAEGKEYKLAFKGHEKAVFQGKEYDYECLKLEKDTYFVRFGLNFAVLDLEQCLATFVLGDTYISGAIACPGHEQPKALPADAGDAMVGTQVRWVLGCGRYVNHDYFAEGKVRAAWSPKDELAAELPCRATKLKETLYLVDIKGGVPKDVCAPFFTNRVIMLQDYDHMILVGCVLGTGFDPVMIAGYAKFLN